MNKSIVPYDVSNDSFDKDSTWHLLTTLEQAFVIAYAKTFDFTTACQEANLNPTRFRYHFNGEKIQKAISEYVLTQPISPQEVISEVTKIFHADMGDFLRVVEVDGKEEVQYDLLKAIKMHKTGLIREVEIDRRGKVRIKLYDRMEAMRLLGRYMGLFPETLETRDVTDWRQRAREAGLNPSDVEAEARRLLNMADSIPNIIDSVATVTPDAKTEE